jgi:hypothetical protein
MRYIPSSRYTLDEIADQCRQAVLRAQGNNNCQTVDYTEVRKFFRYDDAYSVRPMKDYGSLIKV